MKRILITETETTLSEEKAKNLEERNFILLCKEVHHYWNVVRQENQVGTVQTLNILGQGVHRRSFYNNNSVADLRCKRENLLKIRSISPAKVGIYIYFWAKNRCKFMLQCVSFVNFKLCGDDNSVCMWHNDISESRNTLRQRPCYNFLQCLLNESPQKITSVKLMS